MVLHPPPPPSPCPLTNMFLIQMNLLPSFLCPHLISSYYLLSTSECSFSSLYFPSPSLFKSTTSLLLPSSHFVALLWRWLAVWRSNLWNGQLYFPFTTVTQTLSSETRTWDNLIVFQSSIYYNELDSFWSSVCISLQCRHRCHQGSSFHHWTHTQSQPFNPWFRGRTGSKLEYNKQHNGLQQHLSIILLQRYRYPSDLSMMTF